MMDRADIYIKILHERVGDHLFDPEPVHDPLLERIDKDKLACTYEVLSDLMELIINKEIEMEKSQAEWLENPIEGGGRIG